MASERRQVETWEAFHHIPVLGWSAPSNEQVAISKTLQDDPQQKIFVHCYYGEDRSE